MPPTVNAVLLAILCTLTTALLVVSARIWARLRALPVPDLMRQLGELRRAQTELADAVERLRADKKAGRPAGSRSHRFDRAEGNAVPGPTLITVPNLAAAPDVNHATSEELGRRFGSIWSLADEGASADTIAQHTGQPIGQVELILGLRRQLVAHGVLNSPAGSRH